MEKADEMSDIMSAMRKPCPGIISGVETEMSGSSRRIVEPCGMNSVAKTPRPLPGDERTSWFGDEAELANSVVLRLSCRCQSCEAQVVIDLPTRF